MKKYDEKSLRKLQLTELEILIEIDKICKKNKINYWLDFGTLLGAVRHKGFIPWDDDIDISMLREDYNKFCSICKKELNPNYYLHDFKSDSNYWLPYAKVRKKNTLLDEKNISHLDLQKEIFVDVFPVDNISSRNIKFESKAVNILQTLLLYKINICNNKILNIVLRFIKIEWLHKLIIFFMTKNDKKNSKLLAAYGSIRDINKKIFEKDDFVPVKKMSFEGHLFSVPCKYKKVLTQVYGKDYMQLPPVEKRITHNPVKVSFDTNDENETYYG